MFADDDVDPEIRGWLTRMAEAARDLGAGPDTTIPELRAICEQQRRPWREGGPVMAQTEELRVGRSGVRLRIHRPTGASGPQPVLVYLHGGGWVLFSLDTHDRLMREYAARAGVTVVGVDYRLSPEHPFPAALDDTAEVLAWIDAEGAAHGLDATRVALGGDSAGANLAVSSAILRREAELPPAKALLLNYGAFCGARRPSFERYAHPQRYMLTPDEMDQFWGHYLGDPALRTPLARPIDADLAGLPPAWLCVPACDILADESAEMARRMEAAGVPATLALYPGATHSFLEAVSVSKLADRAFAEASGWLAERLI